MDWATFFKDYPAVVGLLGIVLGFAFNSLLARWRRKQELEDRQYKRRSEIHDTRIKEARGYFDSYTDIFIGLEKFEKELIENSTTPEKLVVFLQEHKKRYDEIPDLMDKLTRSTHSLELINDIELHDLFVALSIALLVETTNVPRIVDIVGGIENYNKEEELERVSDFSTKIQRLSTKIEAKLDKLAEKVP